MELFNSIADDSSTKISNGRKLLKLAEECSELSAAINGNFFKDKDVTDNVFEEMADVYVVLASLYKGMSISAKERFVEKINLKIEKFKNQVVSYDYPPIIIDKLNWL